MPAQKRTPPIDYNNQDTRRFLAKYAGIDHVDDPRDLESILDRCLQVYLEADKPYSEYDDTYKGVPWPDRETRELEVSALKAVMRVQRLSRSDKWDVILEELGDQIDYDEAQAKQLLVGDGKEKNSLRQRVGLAVLSMFDARAMGYGNSTTTPHPGRARRGAIPVARLPEIPAGQLFELPIDRAQDSEITDVLNALLSSKQLSPSQAVGIGLCLNALPLSDSNDRKRLHEMQRIGVGALQTKIYMTAHTPEVNLLQDFIMLDQPGARANNFGDKLAALSEQLTSMRKTETDGDFAAAYRLLRDELLRSIKQLYGVDGVVR